MNSKMRILISLGLASVVSLCLWFAWDQKTLELESKFSMGPVVRAKKYIKRGKVLTKNHVEIVEMPLAYREPTAITELSEILNKKGKAKFKARIGILKGGQISRANLVEKSDKLGISWALDEGEVALTLRLKSDEAVGGWVQPGSSVHIYNWMNRQENWPEPRVGLLLSGVPVLAVDGRAWDPSSPIVQKNNVKSVVNDEFLVTIKLTVAQVAKVILAQEKGDIRLGLVSPFETKGVSGISAGLNSLK